MHLTDHPGLREDQEGQDILLIKERENLVHLKEQEVLLGHGLLVARERIQDDNADPLILDVVTNKPSQFAGRQLGWIDLPIEKLPLFLKGFCVHPDTAGPPPENAAGLVKADNQGLFALLHPRVGVKEAKRGFAGS